MSTAIRNLVLALFLSLGLGSRSADDAATWIHQWNRIHPCETFKTYTMCNVSNRIPYPRSLETVFAIQLSIFGLVCAYIYISISFGFGQAFRYFLLSFFWWLRVIRGILSGRILLCSLFTRLRSISHKSGREKKKSTIRRSSSDRVPKVETSASRRWQIKNW